MTGAGGSGDRAADGAVAETARAEQGMAVRRQVLGDEHVTGARRALAAHRLLAARLDS